MFVLKTDRFSGIIFHVTVYSYHSVYQKKTNQKKKHNADLVIYIIYINVSLFLMSLFLLCLGGREIYSLSVVKLKIAGGAEEVPWDVFSPAELREMQAFGQTQTSNSSTRATYFIYRWHFEGLCQVCQLSFKLLATLRVAIIVSPEPSVILLKALCMPFNIGDYHRVVMRR